MFYYLNSSSSLRDNHHLIISIFILKTSKLSHFAFFSPSFSLRLYLINYFLSKPSTHKQPLRPISPRGRIIYLFSYSHSIVLGGLEVTS